jgi:hypothetical protein
VTAERSAQAWSLRAGLADQRVGVRHYARLGREEVFGLGPESAGAESTVRTVDGCRGLVNVQPARPQTTSQWRAQAATEPVGANSTTTWPTAVLNEYRDSQAGGWNPGHSWRGGCQWIGMRLDLSPDGPDWQEVAEILTDAYRQVAPKFLIARLD